MPSSWRTETSATWSTRCSAPRPSATRPAPSSRSATVQVHGEGPAHLHRHLLDLDLGDFNPRGHALDTPGKLSMVLTGKSEVAYWIQMLKDDPTQALKALGEG